MARIRLSPLGHVISTDLGVVLHSDVGTAVLDGRDLGSFVDKTLALLDGTRDRDEVADAVSDDLRPSVLIFLQLLERQGLLETIEETHDPVRSRWIAQERFFRAWTERPKEAIRRLSDASILIVGLEPWGVVAAGQLAAAGIGRLHVLDDGNVAPGDLLSVQMWHVGLVGYPRGQALVEFLAMAAPWCRVTTSAPSLATGGSLALPKIQWDLVIGTMAPDDLPGHLRLASFADEARVMSMFASLQGLESLIGPIVVPGQTGCWNCCRLRLLANADNPWAAHALQETLLARPAAASVRMSLAPTAAVLGHLLALEALKLLSGYARSQLLGSLFIQNMVTLETTLHNVIPMPWCEVCGGARAIGRGEAKPNKLLQADTPEELRHSLSGWLDSRTGVISQLVIRNQDPQDPPLPVCARAFLSTYTEGTYDPIAFEDCGGKGLTATEALLGAVGEAIERYSASRFRLEDLYRSPVNGMVGDVLDPRELCLYQEAQYDRPGFPFVRFDPDRPHLWTRGRWLDTSEPVWVPALLTFYNFPNGEEDPFCQVTSNGLAAGADLEDASLRALLELVERDAFMLTWLCRRPGRRLIVEDGLEPGIREVLRGLNECGAQIELYLLDVGLTIPTVVCLGLGDGRRWPGLTVSSAAHMSPRVAVRKAILEHGYSGLSLRRLMVRGEHSIPERPDQVRTSNFVDHALFYLPAPRAAACNFLRSGVNDGLSLDNLAEPAEISLDACAKRVALSGVRVALVNVTSPDVARSPFRVVRALGTHMQPIHCGFGLDRLANPRLRALLTGEVNTDLHPLC